MQDHRYGPNRSSSGHKDYQDAAHFQDGHFRGGDDGQLDYALSSFRDSLDSSTRPSDRDAVKHSQDHLHSLWAPISSNNEVKSRSSNIPSLGFNDNGHWATSTHRDVKDANFPPSMKYNRGPLDVHTSPISSPVSSSEESLNKANQRDAAAMEQHYEQAIQYASGNSASSARYLSSDMSRAGEDEVEAAMQQQMRASFERANRLANGGSDLQRAYSTGQDSSSIYGKNDSDTLWYQEQRRAFDAQSAYEAHLRSSAASSSGDTTQARALEQFGPPFVDSTPEFSVFVGDLAPELREEDLVAQFLHPSAWPASHPFAIAHAHAQQAKGNYSTLAKIRPAPFTSTKSAKIMKDPMTGVSRGFGFVRFSTEEDCARALIEMQGMIVSSPYGPGRPLRVCKATPKNRPVAQSVPISPWGGPSMSDALSFFQQHVQASQDRTGTSDLSSMHEQAIAAMYLSGGKGGNSAPFSPTSSTFYSHLPAMDKPSINANPMTYSNSALDPNNTTVFVGGLSSLISEDTLKTFFAPFGEIIYVKIPPGKGCGFVQFVRKMDAERAIERMQGFPIGGGRIRLSWGRSQGDKAAAAAAQVVAQTAQMNHLASLASLSSMTPAQLNHLRAGMSNEANETDTQFLQRLAAYTASSNVENRERESLDLQRVASLQHMPAMEQQHRNAQRQAGGALGYPFDQAALHESFPDREQNGFKTSPDGSSDDYLASLIPGLRLDGFEGTRLAPPQQSRSGLTTPMTPDGRNHSQFLSPSGNVKGPLYQSSSIFSPFSPPISPSRFDEGSPSQSASSKEQRHGNASDSN